MRIVLIIDRFDANNGANIKIAFNLAKEFAKRNDVYIYGKHDCNAETPINVIFQDDEVKKYSFEGKIDIKVNYYRDILAKENVGKKITWCIKHPILFGYIILNRCCAKYMNNILEVLKVKWDLKRFIKREKIDCVIAFTAPIYPVLEITGLKKVKKIWYQLDPYSSNVYTKNKKRAAEVEKKILAAIDYTFVTKPIYEEYSNIIFQKYINKAIIVEFPNLVRVKSSKKKIEFDAKKINCVFAGNFYERIRNPEFTLKLFTLFNNPNIILHLYGAGCEEEVEYWEKKSNGRIIKHGSVSYEKISNILSQADCLVSINNSNRNQVPSKIIEYIGIGRPILNICKVENCPTLPYLHSYPLVYIIKEEDVVDICALEEFLINCKNKCIEWNYLKDVYYQFTPETVANTVEKYL